MNHISARTRILVLSVLAPLVVCLAGIALMVSWLPSLPDVVAIHWGLDGRPDGYGPASTLPLLLGVIGVPTVAFVGWLVLWFEAGRPFTPALKLLAVTSLWTSLVLTIGFAGSLSGQRVSEGAGAPAPAAPLAWAFGVATCAALLAWFLLPRSVSPIPSAGSATAALRVAAGERVAWVRDVSAPRPLVVALIALGVLVTGAAATAILVTGGRMWFVAVAPLVIVVLTASTLAWRIRVDSHGLVVRSALGVPRVTIPLDQIEQAHVEEVDPVGQFGGWGWRWGFGRRSGVILRAGDALAVKRRSGATFLVTVDDADSAASLLNGLVARGGLATR